MTVSERFIIKTTLKRSETVMLTPRNFGILGPLIKINCVGMAKISIGSFTGPMKNGVQNERWK